MAEYYEACPRCGRTNFGEIYHCRLCGTEFCTKCTGTKTLPDGTQCKCCPRCGEEFEDDESIYVVVTESENRRNKL